MNSGAAALRGHQPQNNLHSYSNTAMPAVTDANIQKMSSLEIAELTGKEHKNVMADIKNVLGQAGIEEAKFSAPFKMPSGQNTVVYKLPRRECDLVISGYSVRYRLAIIDRWHQLETQEVASNNGILSIDFSNPTQVAGLLAQSLQKTQEQAQQIESDRPKIEFHDRVVVAQDSISIVEAAKVLGTGRNRLLSQLRQLKWVNRYNEPYQAKIESGHLDVKLGSFSHPRHGLQQSVTTMVTGKGLAALDHLLQRESREVSK